MGGGGGGIQRTELDGVVEAPPLPPPSTALIDVTAAMMDAHQNNLSEKVVNETHKGHRVPAGGSVQA